MSVTSTTLNSIFVFVNTIIQVKVITKHVAICFDPCWLIIMCISVYLKAEIFVQYESIFSIIFEYMLKWSLLITEVNKKLASKYTEVRIHLKMTQYWSQHIVINTNVRVNKFCYSIYLNCCVDRYDYTVLNDTQQDATRENSTRLHGIKLKKRIIFWEPQIRRLDYFVVT